MARESNPVTVHRTTNGVDFCTSFVRRNDNELTYEFRRYHNLEAAMRDLDADTLLHLINAAAREKATPGVVSVRVKTMSAIVEALNTGSAAPLQEVLNMLQGAHEMPAIHGKMIRRRPPKRKPAVQVPPVAPTAADADRKLRLAK